MRPALAAAALTLFAAGEASAQSRPQFIPLRDVDITYRVTQSGRTLTERVRWLAAAKFERVDPPGPIYMIVDHATHHLWLVDTARRSVLELDAPSRTALQPDESAAFVRAGQAKVAGLSCTEWRVATSEGEAKQLCVTADGVLLRAEQAGRPLVRALSVRYGPLKAKAFQVPTDYERAPPPAAAPPPIGSGPAEP